MYVITVTHTQADGTLADGTRRGDQAGAVLRSHGFRYSRTIDMWYLPRSRDKRANTGLIDRVDAALREAGFRVETSIDNDVTRSFAEAEADRTERAEERADRFQTYADNASARAESRYQAGHQMLDAIPMGQPILVGHHSERADQRYRGRAHDHLDASVQEERKSNYWSNRADVAAGYQAKRANVGTTMRRIEKLEASERFWANTLKTGHNSAGWTTSNPDQVEEINCRLADVREQLAYWREQIAAAEQAGVKLWSKTDFAKGDFVRSGRTWYEVMRVNAKSLTVPYLRHPTSPMRKDDPTFLWTAKIQYHEVSGRMSARELTDAMHAVALEEAASGPMPAA